MNMCGELLCYFIFRAITSIANVSRYFIYFVMHLAQIILFCLDITSKVARSMRGLDLLKV